MFRHRPESKLGVPGGVSRVGGSANLCGGTDDHGFEEVRVLRRKVIVALMMALAAGGVLAAGVASAIGDSGRIVVADGDYNWDPK